MPETETPTAANVRADPVAKQRAIRLLWQLDRIPGGRRQPYLYAILDAARDGRIYPRLRELAATEEIRCLYQGRAATEMAAVAPYLVCLGTTDRVFDWIWNEAWGESWGIFLWSLASPETLRTHFRRLTIVQTEERQRLLFRFYDPRVLRAFLPICEPEQTSEFFGPISAYFLETDDAEAIVCFRSQGGSPMVTEPLTTSGRARSSVNVA